MNPTQATSAARAAGARWARIHMLEYVLWGAAWIAAIFLPRGQLIFNEIAILGLFALSLDLILGYAGVVSLGHGAFLGMGAYSAALLAKYFGIDPILGLVGAAVISAALGFVSSFLVLRGSDLTRLMVTLGVTLMLLELANKLDWLTGGADGLQGVVIPPILGRFDFDLAGKTAALYSMSVLTIAFFVARRIVRSPFGMSLQAIRENRLRAVAMGIPVNARLVAIYTIAGAFAGIAGGLLAQTTGFASLDGFEFHRSADVLLVLVIGGTGYLYGGLIGAALFTLMQDALASATPQYWQFWIGMILVTIVLVSRERIATFAERVSSYLGALISRGGVR